MSRIIVSIISEQTIPNYIFIKEKFQIGDELLFICSVKMLEKVEPILATLGYVNCKTSTISLKENEEEKWVDMCNRIYRELDRKAKYLVNLTGGTKYMSMAVLRIFEEYDSSFFYIPFPKNELLQLNDNEPAKLSYKVTINEYLSLYNVLQEGSPYKIAKDENFTNSFFNLFIEQKFSTNEFQIIDLLRAYRDKGIKDIDAVENIESINEKKPQIVGLRSFVEKYSFVDSTLNLLSATDIQYITGGWFEEYVYFKLKNEIHPTDIAIGIKIKRQQNPFLNDLDVVFTIGNKLFVIECKTGISSVKMLNETVYKATALKETLFGLSGNTFIFSLGGTVENFQLTAKNMGITYYDRSYFTDSNKWNEIIDKIKNTAKV
jgi:hypothetical protein